MNTETKEILRSKGIYLYDVIDIIKDYYGDAFVDDYNISSNDNIEELENIVEAPIVIWFPQITVTNEYGKYTVIYDVYVKLLVKKLGELDTNRPITITKATYTEAQFLSGYVHSHLPRYFNSPTFSEPCLGGSSPVKDLIMSLKESYSESNWMLLCPMITEYLQTESIVGGPYIKLESINKYGRCINTSLNIQHYWSSDYITINRKHIYLNDFIRYLAKNKILTYNYVNHYYNIACSNEEFIIKVTNAFLEYLKISNIELKEGDKYLFNTFLYKDGKFYGENTDSINSIKNKHVVTFKGTDIYMKVFQNPNESINYVYILDMDYLRKLYGVLIDFINNYYGTKNDTTRQAVVI